LTHLLLSPQSGSVESPPSTFILSSKERFQVRIARLIGLGGDVNMVNKLGYNLLFFVLHQSSEYDNLAKFLVHKGADMDRCDPLRVATENNKFDMVKYLIENGSNADASKALITASGIKNKKIFEYIFERTSNFSAQKNSMRVLEFLSRC
jgi:ankyrin repeat protein